MVTLYSAILAVAVSTGQGETVLLDFYADWCGPCKQMDHAVRQLAERGYPIRKVNFDQKRDLAAKYGVQYLPTFVMLVDGKVVDRHVGPTSLNRLEGMVAQARSGSQTRSNPDGSQIPWTGTEQDGPTALGRDNPPPVSPIPLPPTPGDTVQPRTISDETLIAVTVRIRIEDSGGQSCGTGTIIDARQGEALILTCGHIFRDWEQDGQITVDLFGPSPAQGITGRLVCYDAARDVALLAIHTPGPVIAANVAPAGCQVRKGDRVINVGCNNGDPPTVRRSRVTSIDRYQGPPNLQVTGLPVQGRSGGGLFSDNGLVIGVCNAADPAENEGFYAALPSIHAQLDKAELSFTYQDRGPAGTHETDPDLPPMPPRMPDVSDLTQDDRGSSGLEALELDQGGQSAGRLSQEERASLDEILLRVAEGAEVICVIRPRRNPGAPSEIIMLDRASPAFLEQLAHEAGRARSRRYTSLEIPRESSNVRTHQGQQFLYPTARSLPRSLPSTGGPPASMKDPQWQPDWMHVPNQAH